MQHVKTVKLGEICRPKQWPTISSEQMTYQGYVVYGANGKIGYYTKYTHEHPTLMITCRGATCGTLNISEPFAYINGNAMALDSLAECAVLKFVYYALLRRGMGDVISGSAQPQITRQGMDKITIPMPTLDTQRHIAAVLDRADALRQKDRQLLAYYEQLPQAVFLEMFGDPVRNEKRWEVINVSDIGIVQGGLQVTPVRRDYPIEVPYLRVANVFKNKLWLGEVKYIRVTNDELKRTALQKDDILIVEGHANPDEIGRSAIWDDSIKSCTHQNHLIKLRVDKTVVSPTFTSFYLNTDGGRSQLMKIGKTTSGLNTISSNSVRNLKLFHPPLILQNEFADIIQTIEQQKKLVIAQLATSESLFQSLLHQAFTTGELMAVGSAVDNAAVPL